VAVAASRAAGYQAELAVDSIEAVIPTHRVFQVAAEEKRGLGAGTGAPEAAVGGDGVCLGDLVWAHP